MIKDRLTALMHMEAERKTEVSRLVDRVMDNARIMLERRAPQSSSAAPLRAATGRVIRIGKK